MENYYMSKCQTMSHGDIIMKKQAKKIKALTCLQNSVTNVMIPEEEILYVHKKDNITMGIYK